MNGSSATRRRATYEDISPSTERMDRSRKMRISAREVVMHLWLLDPIAESSAG